MKISVFAPLLAATIAAAFPATAAPVYVSTNADLAIAPFSFTLQGATFTFSTTGDIFAPLTVQNSATGEFSSFGGFAGFPLVPSPSFVDRGTVQYGPDVFGAYGSFPEPTSIFASNGNNFLGFRANVGDDAYYGFVFTTDGVLNGYGFETSANTTITAIAGTPAVPEPGTWAMMIGGLGIAGGLMRRRKAMAKISFA